MIIAPATEKSHWSTSRAQLAQGTVLYLLIQNLVNIYNIEDINLNGLGATEVSLVPISISECFLYMSAEES